MNAKHAKLIHTNLPDFRGKASLYKLDPPLKDYNGNSHEYVIASTADVFSGVETYLFPSNEAGEVVSWSELPGSKRGGYSHVEIFDDLGYTVEN